MNRWVIGRELIRRRWRLVGEDLRQAGHGGALPECGPVSVPREPPRRHRRTRRQTPQAKKPRETIEEDVHQGVRR